MKLSKRIKYYAEYIAFRAGIALMDIFPWGAAVKIGETLGLMASYVVVNRYKITIDNLKKAFPGKTQKEITAIAKGSWKNAGRIFAEFIKAGSISEKQLLEKLEFKNPQVLQPFIDNKKPLIVHLGHFTNWEILTLAYPLVGANITVLAKEIRNPYVNNYIFKTRKKYGCKFVLHRNPFFSCVKALKNNNIMPILMDQNMPGGDKFFPFLGRMASVTPLTALLALKMQTPIMPLKLTREGDKIVAFYEDIIYPESRYSEQALDDLIIKLNSYLEKWIIQNPTLWLWLHNRWKREPDYYKIKQEREADAAAAAAKQQ